LRERREDILPLAKSFAGQVYSLNPAVNFAPEALALLERYTWPGNIRELENAVVRAAAMCDGTIRVQDLPERVRDFRQEATVAIESTEEKEPGNDPQGWPSLAEVEGRYVARVLEHTSGNKQAAARLLGVDRKTVERIVRRQHPNSPLLREAS
jgi:two-component system response regulator AtoC